MIEDIKNVKIVPLLMMGAAVFLLYLSLRRPYLFDATRLVGLLGLVIAGFIGSQYRTHFWTLMIIVFFWAGSDVPLSGSMNIFRWVVLALAAFLALGDYARSAHKIHFNHVHLLALLTVVAAFASALVSVNWMLTTSKALSLAALFIYGCIGVRVLWGEQPQPFLDKLSLLAEGLVYFTAACYLVSFEVWGNPNSLGLIMGVFCWPILLWRFIPATNRREYIRRLIALLACGVLLVASLSRASMLAAFLSSMFLLVGTRRYRTLIAGIAIFVIFTLNVFIIAPQRFSDSADTLLYKKGEKGHLLGSRQKPWERSLATFQEHPWLGLGFGAADNSSEWHGGYATPGQQVRERGSSYLTMLEGTGILGTLPLILLVLSLIRDVRRVFLWLRFSGNPNQPAVIASLIVLSCLVGAFFEDWLLAVGYYMSVIFWVIALSLRDWMACPVFVRESAPDTPLNSRVRLGLPDPRSV